MGAQGSCCGDRESYDEEEYDVFYDAEDDAEAASPSARWRANPSRRKRSPGRKARSLDLVPHLDGKAANGGASPPARPASAKAPVFKVATLRSEVNNSL